MKPRAASGALARNARMGVGVLLALAVIPIPGRAQTLGMRGWAGTTIQAVEMRPLAQVAGGCVEGEPCYLPAGEQLSLIGTQDVSLTAWGFGVEGLSATVYMRGRAGMGSDFVWPRSADHFDALLGYAQWIRSGWTVRLGRQEIRSGLGFASFDGASAGWRIGTWNVEGYGGRSLARGLRDPAYKALEGIEDFVPDQNVYLFGGSARGRVFGVTSTLRYQREILADRSGLAAERASFDAATTLPRVSLAGGIDWDFGRQQPGKGHLTASSPFGGGRWMASLSARRYVPYFSLSTIWGFFEPVAYHEAMARVGWSATTSLGLWASGGWRLYGDTETTTVLRALEDTGWRGEAGAAWSFSPMWTVDGSYRMEWGPGGYLSSGDGSLRWSPTDRYSLAVTGTAFQQVEQYRLGDGRAYGAGFTFDAGLTSRVTFVGGASMIRHSVEGDGVESPWNQARGWSTLRVAIGRDAGRANRMRR